MNTAARTEGARLGLRFWCIALAALAAVLLTASLGRWQLSRAAQKEALQAAMDERAAQPPVGGAALTAAAVPQQTSDGQGVEALVHRTAVLRGQWVADATVFLDNRQMHGRPGFFVLTPLKLAGQSAATVVVQRGWVPRDFQDRTRLPEVPTPAGEVEVTGRIASPPSRLYDPGGTGAGEGSSRIRQNLDLTAYGAEHGLVLVPLSLLQTGNDDTGPQGLRRDWPAIDSGVDKHYGYAFQWFGLSGLVVILYVWFQIVRRFLRPRGKPSSAA